MAGGYKNAFNCPFVMHGPVEVADGRDINCVGVAFGLNHDLATA